MVKATIIGHFGKNKTFLDGQTVKTKVIYDYLVDKYGSKRIKKYDTYGSKRFLFKSPFVVLISLIKSENVIILPAHRGLKVLVPLINFFNKIFKRRIHYCVIGGWLPRITSKEKRIKNRLMRIDHIYVETLTMQKALNEQGFHNVIIMKNCKKLRINSLISKNNTDSIVKLCTFSRVMRQKGIEDIVEALKVLNGDEVLYSLDIYGQIDNNEIDWFNNLKSNFPFYINYCGCVDYHLSVDTIKNYNLLVFPTKFYTEGIPGTIIDSFASGVPVLSSKWESFDDIIIDGVTGIGYEFDNVEDLIIKLKFIYNNINLLENMSMNCIKEAEQYLPNNALKVLDDNL